MSQDSESDIWEYRSLRRVKRRVQISGTSQHGPKKARPAQRQSSEPGRGNRSSKANPQVKASPETRATSRAPSQSPPGPSHRSVPGSHPDEKPGPGSGGRCPVCQMPFSILVVQSTQWHVSECLETPGEAIEECADGLRCSSTIPSHYRRYGHSLLAHSRATGTGCSVLSPGHASSPLGPTTRDHALTVSGEGRPEGGAPNPSTASTLDPSPGPSTPPKRPDAFALLRSPGPDDVKKKKGWSPARGTRTPVRPSREADINPPARADEGNEIKKEPGGLEDEEFISYSPLPDRGDSRDADGDHDDSDSVMSCNDLGSDDGPSPGVSGRYGAEDRSPKIPGKNPPGPKPPLGSPQSLVLERLRECVSSSSPLTSLTRPGSDTQSHRPGHQTPTETGSSSALTQPKARVSGPKQTDIGVFFGLKPLREKSAGVRPEEEASEPRVSSESGKGSKGGKRSTAAPTSEGIRERAGRPAGGGGEAKPQRRRPWNKGGATGGAPATKQCPFYKKIPGTGFAVDAFQYGAVEGVTAYFLTHFHSDHYNGLTKHSTLPVYCNRVTGNLVKTKLRVDERHVHVLPMNRECTVDGVKVLLLDANHCPGSAMLLFVLPDGQTVLHTGDFRADPCMEEYPELQSLRVQTLYLDTTYCSPQYAFPTQREVISFVANTAFELVTLNPRTLVVCGTYSVGKEKVFLAIGQVLSSKVYMSKEKHRTMCCLESQQICQSITADVKEMKAARVHVLPMMQLNFKNLKAYLNKLCGTYDQLVAFKPTGWTFTRAQGVLDIRPQVEGNISIYGVPYSEHSSFLELQRFVQWLRPLKIIPTVHVGSWSSREDMKHYFAQWKAEVGGW